MWSVGVPRPSLAPASPDGPALPAPVSLPYRWEQSRRRDDRNLPNAGVGGRGPTGARREPPGARGRPSGLGRGSTFGAWALPGDDAVAEPATQVTRGITIDAPAAAVWRWLVQIGADRGGFYSYDRLENLFGLGIHSADEIVPEVVAAYHAANRER